MKREREMPHQQGSGTEPPLIPARFVDVNMIGGPRDTGGAMQRGTEGFLLLHNNQKVAEEQLCAKRCKVSGPSSCR